MNIRYVRIPGVNSEYTIFLILLLSTSLPAHKTVYACRSQASSYAADSDNPEPQLECGPSQLAGRMHNANSYSLPRSDITSEFTHHPESEMSMFQMREEQYRGGKPPERELMAESLLPTYATCYSSDNPNQKRPAIASFYGKLKERTEAGAWGQSIPYNYGVGINLFESEKERQSATNDPRPDFRANEFSVPIGFNPEYFEPTGGGPDVFTGEEFNVSETSLKQVTDPDTGTDELIVEIREGTSTTPPVIKHLTRVTYCY
jgi:hypothetical protein